ncbi:hypothetical protein PR048_019730 [Dryococelus australis]|uniref:Uncharacterized protein n=1 Tax=Dryococelus australis TaxID=614101 RepID=A0ABQ9H496_9NEOP|nr:hypothetical protein PR048_019730 [Dryococelus australis]
MLEDPWADLESKHSSSIGGRSIGAKLSFASENSVRLSFANENNANLSTALSDTEESVDVQEGEGHISSSEGSA